MDIQLNAKLLIFLANLYLILFWSHKKICGRLVEDNEFMCKENDFFKNDFNKISMLKL